MGPRSVSSRPDHRGVEWVKWISSIRSGLAVGRDRLERDDEHRTDAGLRTARSPATHRGERLRHDEQPDARTARGGAAASGER